MSASAMVVCILSSEGKTSDDEIPHPIRYERLPGVTAWQLILADISQLEFMGVMRSYGEGKYKAIPFDYVDNL